VIYNNNNYKKTVWIVSTYKGVWERTGMLTARSSAPGCSVVSLSCPWSDSQLWSPYRHTGRDTWWARDTPWGTSSLHLQQHRQNTYCIAYYKYSYW